jgi:Ca2+-binding EF-hand superfamily protein
MKTKTIILTAVAAAVALGSTAPAFAAESKAARHEKRVVHMIKRIDLNGDQRISHDEMASALARTFQVVDTNNDGAISASEVSAQKAVFKAYRADAKAMKASGERPPRLMKLPKALKRNFAKVDANGDGVVSKSEISALASKIFKRADRNRDGFISQADIRA